MRIDYNDNESWLEFTYYSPVWVLTTWMIFSPFFLCNLAIDMVSCSLSLLDYTSMLYILLWGLISVPTVSDKWCPFRDFLFLVLFHTFYYLQFYLHVSPCFQNFYVVVWVFCSIYFLVCHIVIYHFRAKNTGHYIVQFWRQN